MIIYQDTKAGFLDDIQNNYFAARIEDAFLKKTGSLPSDSRGWANDYARFSTVLSQANIADDIQVAIEYHCSPVGRTRIDVLLAGGDGTVKQHPSLQARNYKGMILSFNQSIADAGVALHPSAYLCNLYRRTPEPLEDAPDQSLLTDSRLFLADDSV